VKGGGDRRGGASGEVRGGGGELDVGGERRENGDWIGEERLGGWGEKGGGGEGVGVGEGGRRGRCR